MKKMLFGLLLSLLSTATLAAVDIEESPLFVRALVTNTTTQWFSINTDNTGVALNVTSGSCKVEVAFEPLAKCKVNLVTPFDWDGSNSIVVSGGKKFMSINGVSCVRAVCTSGTALLLVRRH